MPEFRMEMGCWRVSIPVGGLLAVVLAVCLPAAAGAQTSGGEDGTSDGVEPEIEWNFQPRGAPREVGEEDLQARWAAPFAVVSRGSTEARDTREVVVIRGRPELVAADSGETAAIVVVEEGEGLPERVGRLAQSVDTVTPDGGGEVAETPAVEEEAETPAAEEEGEAPGVADEADEEEETERIHTVVRGDTLYGIARRYGVSAAAIRGANSLEGDVVRLGETLVIPEEETSR